MTFDEFFQLSVGASSLIMHKHGLTVHYYHVVLLLYYIVIHIISYTSFRRALVPH